MSNNQWPDYEHRQATLVARRHSKMARSAENYVRGNTRNLLSHLMEGYEQAFSHPNKKTKRITAMPKIVQAAMKAAMERGWKDLARESIENVQPNLPLGNWNKEGKGFVWTAQAEDILAKLERCKKRLEEVTLLTRFLGWACSAARPSTVSTATWCRSARGEDSNVFAAP